MDKKTLIELRVDQSGDARAFKEKELIHLNEYNRVVSWINEALENIEVGDEETSNFNRQRNHNTITILGTRGSGKTSFLLSLLSSFENQSEDVEVLEIIDPTLIEEKGHIFLNVLSLIDDRVTQTLEQSDNNRIKSFQHTSEEWRIKFEALAHALPTLDGIGGNLTDTSWQDPEYIMQRGIRSVTASRKLEKSFRKLVTMALNIIDKKAFIVAFDDIDIDFKKGWPVLELLRKYFVSPQLITILSGDMRLYSLAVRKRQWENFGEQLLKVEGNSDAGMNYLRDLVTETESQYLQKVMKPVRRIHLNTLKEKLFLNPNFDVAVAYKNTKVKNIIDTYNSILKGFGIFNSYQAEIYRAFLLESPLRMQVRFFESNLKESTGDAISLLDPFVSDLYEMRLDIARITSSPQYLNITILDLLLRERILSETHQMQPTTVKPALNGSLTALTFLFSKSSAAGPEIIFDYFVRIGYLRNLLSSLGYNREKDNIEDPGIEDLCRHSGILQDKVLKDNIGMTTAYMVAFRDLRSRGDRPWAGIIPLLGLAGTSKKKQSSRIDRIDYIASNLNPDAKALVYLPLSISQSTLSQSSVLVYSFHVLLSAISELIRKVHSGDTYRGILELSQLRSYPMPDFRQRSSGIIDSDDSAEELDTNANQLSTNPSILESLLTTWVNAYPKKPIPPHLLGKISTRFFFAADAIQSIQKDEKLGRVMHALTVAFLNSVFIEDIKEHITRPAISLNNTRMSDDILINNLQRTVEGDTTELTLSKWLFACPLLLAYIDPSSKLKKAIANYAGPSLTEPSFTISVFHHLMEVKTKYRIVKPRNLDMIVQNFANAGITVFRMIDALNDEGTLIELSTLYSNLHPAERMTPEKLSRIIQYLEAEEEN
ncbi:hypothetical protein ACFQZX_00460 [Mucilaginibacter litoreus]|uniref:AAA+ ATPase domain-containing protein n=1 Tax=Mucilaginibacter litoreus TaxID=1048221 RepID=A0ABW3AM37_9SPHI